MKTAYRVLLVTAAMQLPAAGAALAQNYSGTYVGTYTASGAPGQHQVTLGFTQSGQSMSGTYKTSTGVAGNCSGWLTGNVAQMSCYNTTPTCPGDYFGPYTFSPSAVSWTYTGIDCRGPEQGTGRAKKLFMHKK